MNNNLYEELFLRLELSIRHLSDGGMKPAALLAAVLNLIREALAELRALVLSAGFPSVDAEVDFFKRIKPKFTSEKVFALEVYNLSVSQPVGGLERLELLRPFVEEELRYVRRFFNQFGFLYQYFRSGAVELDHLYFVRGAQVPVVSVPEMPELDPLFATAGDYLFGKFMAMERLQEHLLGMLMPVPAMVHGAPRMTRPRRELRWTGDTINLVELGFGIHDTAQLNEGQASLSEIFSWLEEQLHVKIGRPSRRFEELEGRKRLSKTDFLDWMRNEINLRIDRKNTYDPEAEEEKRQRREKRAASAAKLKALNNRPPGSGASGDGD